MRVTRAIKALIIESARVMHCFGDLLHERAKETRLYTKRAKRHDQRERGIVKPVSADPSAKVPGIIDPSSPEFFERMANEMANANKIGGVNVGDLPNGPPADPGPIGP